MKNRKYVSVILWSARVWGGLSVAFLSWMIVGHLVGEHDSLLYGFKSMEETVSFIFFPLSTLIGLLIAFKREALGGLLTVTGMVFFYITRSDLVFDGMITVLAAPGILFLLYGMLKKSFKKQIA